MTDKDEKDPASIDWRKFRTDFVKLEAGGAKELKLTNWRQGLWFNKPGLSFDVLEEDSMQVSKTLSTNSKRLIRALRPIIQRAEQQDKKVVISVSILKIGQGLDTLYEVKENA